jgi:uncharacterized protein involved in exopolysaccharide biosynthesis
VAVQPQRANVSELMLASTPPPDEPVSHTYGRALRAHRMLVALIILVALGAAIALLQLRPASYSADAELLITPVSQADVNLLGLPLIRDTGESTRTAQTAAGLLQTKEASALTAQRMGGGMTALDVENAVTIEPRGQTNLLAVHATSDGARQAARLADTYATAITELRVRALQRVAQE